MTKEKSLQELLAEFDEIVAWFDNDDLDVDAAIAKFEQGNALAEKIKKQLDTAKNKIEIVKSKFDAPVATEYPDADDFDDQEAE